MAASRHLQGIEFGNLVANGGFNAVMQRHMRGRTAGAHPRQTNGRRAAIDGKKLDVTPVGLQKGPDAIKHSLDSFSLDSHGGCLFELADNGRPS
jgi:hypothetical protein